MGKLIFLLIILLIPFSIICMIIAAIGDYFEKRKERKIERQYIYICNRYPVGIGMWMHNNVLKIDAIIKKYKEVKHKEANLQDTEYKNSIFEYYHNIIYYPVYNVRVNAIAQISNISDLDYNCNNEYNDLKSTYYNGISEIKYFSDASLAYVDKANVFIKIYSLINKDKVRSKHRDKTVLSPFEKVYSKYPLGVLKWLYDEKIIKNLFDFSIDSLSYNDKRMVVFAPDVNFEKIDEQVKKEIENLKDKYPRSITSNETDIEKLQLAYNPSLAEQRHYEHLIEDCLKEKSQWVKEQNKFNSTCLDLCKSKLKGYGYYVYYVPFDEIPYNGIDHSKQYYINGGKTPYDFNDINGKPKQGAIKVWQLFMASYCKTNDADSKFFPNENGKKLPKFKNGSLVYKDSVYDKIFDFIKDLKNIYSDLYVLFIYNKPGWEEFVINSHFFYLVQNLDKYDGNKYYLKNWAENVSMKDVLHATNSKHFIVIDFATENEQLISNCSNIIKNYEGKFRPMIVYLSLLKCYDSDEVKKIIKEKKEKVESAENAHKAFENGVRNWPELYGGLHYNYLLNYYPTTCDFEATDEEWDDRWLVWNFKNTPGKTEEYEHEQALKELLPRFQKLLVDTFGMSNLKYLTLVCIPASSQAKTKARYEEFSCRLCKATGLINAYGHISVVEEKTERRLGGTSINTSQLSFDKEFFKGKYVLLFDDIITRGDSMRTFKKEMESLGSIVVAGLSIGKTKHHRENQVNEVDSIDDIFR